MVSEAFLDLGYTDPEHLPRKEARDLTSSQKNSHGRKHEEAGQRMADQPIMEPTAGDLSTMTPDQRQGMADGYRKIREQHFGHIAARPHTTVENQIRPQLPFDK